MAQAGGAFSCPQQSMITNMDTEAALKDATTALMEAVTDAASQRRVSKSHMGDPDNFRFAQATRQADKTALQKLEGCIKACETHLAAMARQAKQSPGVSH